MSWSEVLSQAVKDLGEIKPRKMQFVFATEMVNQFGGKDAIIREMMDRLMFVRLVYEDAKTCVFEEV